jgi:hypothetical protein
LPRFQAFDNPISLSGLSSLPTESEFGGGGLEISAVVEDVDEDSNPLIFKMKNACSKDQLDYCVGTNWKSKDHTMCKFCVRNS